MKAPLLTPLLWEKPALKRLPDKQGGIMNYAQARQRQDNSGLWDWTTMNARVVRRSAPCSAVCEHGTEEEAARHWYDYSFLFVSINEHPDTMEKCAVCGAWTTQRFAIAQMWLHGAEAELCPEHATIDHLKALHPFSGATQLIHS